MQQYYRFELFRSVKPSNFDELYFLFSTKNKYLFSSQRLRGKSKMKKKGLKEQNDKEFSTISKTTISWQCAIESNILKLKQYNK